MVAKLKPYIYLDYAATTPVDPAVRQAMEPYLTDNFYNPSATYQPALRVRKVLEAARTQVAYWLGAKSSEVVFTAGGTESINLAIHGVMRKHPDGNVVISAIEHKAVLAPAQRHDCRIAAVQPDGRIDLNDLRSKIDDNTVLVSIGYANNEIGTVQPIAQIGRMVQEIRAERRAGGNDAPLYMHTDACQAPNYLDLHVARLRVDLLTLDGSKLYGPKQTGCLYVRAGVVLEPLIEGGNQEFGARAGTENVAGDIGFAVALDKAQSMRSEETARLKKLQAECIRQLEKTLPDVRINGSQKFRLPANIHVTIPGQDNERLLLMLDEAGILAGAGSACNASSEESSHVLHALGLDDAAAHASLRFTMGRTTSASDIKTTVRVLARSIQSA